MRIIVTETGPHHGRPTPKTVMNDVTDPAPVSGGWPALLARIDAVLREHGHASGGAVHFDSLTSRRAGARNYVDLHMHVPADWTLGHAARRRTEVEQALMQAVPGLRATIELLPEGQATVFETQEARQMQEDGA